MIWLLKQLWLPGKRFDVRRRMLIGVVFLFLPLAG
jgi:hypothetical protein